MKLLALAEKGWLPDVLLRRGIHRLLRQRLKEEERDDAQSADEARQRLIAELRSSPIALSPEKPNEQHYELPPAFFEQVLGRRMKYSSGYWPTGVTTLDSSEERMLELTCSRAQIGDGMEVLELGCGWGSLSLWMAERYRGTRFIGVSNSAPQRRFIEARAKQLGLTNLDIITADMNVFDTERRFDRVVSVEMFEHMRNYQRLMDRIAGWLKPGGKLFVHIFCHREYAYAFETHGDDNWMGRYFFTAGLMPSHDLLLHFQERMALEERWVVDGTHYQRTSEAWLSNLDLKKAAIMPVLESVYGDQAGRWLQRWRLFFMACAELFGYRNGQEWWVSHYRFRKK